LTKLPSEDWNVIGIDGPPYPLSRMCSHPTCLDYGSEHHHIWRRSFLGGTYSWVMLPDGTMIGNVLMLCNEHHRQVTENEVQIGWEEDCFFWVADSQELMMLSFQPPHVRPEYENLHHDESTFETAGEKTEPVLDNECPVCRQPLPRPKIQSEKREQKRPRRSWTITVPKDRREDGADTLDTLLEEARLEMDRAGLGYGPERNVRYFVLATVLGLFVQHSRELLGDA